MSLALLTPVAAQATTVHVNGDAELSAALAVALPGDVIDLAPGSYAPVSIVGRGGPDADLTLAGEPGATIAGMTITGSTRIAVTGLAVAPAGTAAAYIDVASSTGVSFRGLHLDGGADDVGAAIWVAPDAPGVVISDSTFLHCASPMCIRAEGPGIVIEHNTFDDLDDSDAVHGFGSGVIRGNHMDHALPHGDGNHNDFIQIGQGGPWTIDGNWMGVRTGGAASIWIDSIAKGVIHDVLIENNVLTGHYAGQDVGIFVAGDDRSVALLPQNVSVINNTVISGNLNSLRFGAAYATIPVEQRPLVANNVGDRLLQMCDRIRSEDNVWGVGEACSPSDVVDDASLDDTGAPTAASALLIGHADPTLAPPTDFFGYARTAPPDIGAIEFRAGPSGPVAPAAVVVEKPPARLRASFVSLRARRFAHRVEVFVRCRNATLLRASLLVRGRIVARASLKDGSLDSLRLRLHAPRKGRLVVRIVAFGAGGSDTRTIAVGALR